MIIIQFPYIKPSTLKKKDLDTHTLSKYKFIKKQNENDNDNQEGNHKEYKKDTTLFNILDSKTIRKKCTINQNKHKEMSKVKRSIIKIEKKCKTIA